MPSVNEIYGSGGQFLSSAIVKSEKLVGKPLTITEADKETVGTNQKEKLVLSFNETSLRLVLNRTNATIISEIYSDDYSSWVNKKIQLAITKVNFKGEIVDSILVVIPSG